MPKPQSFVNKSHIDPLPEGGIVLARKAGLSQYASDDHVVIVKAELAVGVFAKPAVGRLLHGSKEWSLHFQIESTGLKVSILDVADEIVTDCFLSLFHESTRISYRGKNWTGASIGPRESIFMDAKPLAIWWDAWRDKDVSQHIERFVWIDKARLGEDWPVPIAIIHSLDLLKLASVPPSLMFPF